MMKTATLCAAPSSTAAGGRVQSLSDRTYVPTSSRDDTIGAALRSAVGREHYSYDRSYSCHGVRQIAAADGPVTVSGGGRRGRGLRSSWPVGMFDVAFSVSRDHQPEMRRRCDYHRLDRCPGRLRILPTGAGFSQESIRGGAARPGASWYRRSRTHCGAIHPNQDFGYFRSVWT